MKLCKLHKNIMLSITAISLILLGQHISGLKMQPQPIAHKPIPHVRMFAVGDIMLDRAVASHMKKYGNDSILENLAGPHDQQNEFFADYDLITGNLEGAVADYRRQTSKSIAFNFSDESVNWLMDYGFNLVSLANNHSYDMGGAGFEETRQTLREIGLEFYGEQYSVDKDAILIKSINGLELAFIGLNDTNRYVEKTDVLPLLQQAEEDADYTIINIHWGQEYQLQSNTHQQDLAHYMIDNGADVVIGHHPHVIQEVEMYNNRPIFYSLGNFIFDQYFSEETQQGLGLEIIFMPSIMTIKPHGFVSQLSEVSLMNETNLSTLIDRIFDDVPEHYFNNEEYSIEISL